MKSIHSCSARPISFQTNPISKEIIHTLQTNAPCMKRPYLKRDVDMNIKFSVCGCWKTALGQKAHARVSVRLPYDSNNCPIKLQCNLP